MENLLDDKELILKFVTSLDEAAFDELTRRYYAYALTIAGKLLQDHKMAEDAVQESFLKVIKNRRQYKIEYSFKSWFSTIVRNTCLDLLRQRSRTFVDFEQVAYGLAANGLAQNDHFGDLVAPLQEQDRKIMTYRFVEGMTFEQISQKMGSTVEAVKKRSQRALKKLKHTLFLFPLF